MARTLLLWVFLLAAAIGLISAERHLQRQEQEARDASHRIGRLIPAADRERLSVAAIRVGPADGPRHLYSPVSGVWRCQTHFNAVAGEEAVQGLLKSLLEGEGVVQSTDPARAGEYGIGLPDSWRLQLLGPSGATQFEVELGARIPSIGGCYVRRSDHSAVWALDTDPWEPLQVDPAGVRPPLLDPHVIPRIWPGKSRRVDRLVLARAGEPPLELIMEELRISEEEMRAGKSPYIWHLRIGDQEASASDRNAMAYFGFLLQIPFVRVLDPAEARGFGLDESRTRVTLYPAEGHPAELRLGSRLPSGNLPLLNLETGMLFEVTPDIAALVVPDAKLLLGSAETNPWETQMRR
ncbi:MAG: hypothetical protein V2A76_18330 [Planctomycetota bacterium]